MTRVRKGLLNTWQRWRTWSTWRENKMSCDSNNFEKGRQRHIRS